MTICFDEPEQEWIQRRARKIARESGDPLPIAQSAAMAELIRLRRQPKASVIHLGAARSAAKGKPPRS